MLHVLRHDEWHWHWQEAATLYNQENDKYSIRVACEQQERSYDRKYVCCSQATIRATYYIFCCRNRNWDSPDLMQFWFLFFSLLFFFWIIQSQAAFVNCLYVARFTIVHSKTQIKFPLFLLLLLMILPSRFLFESVLLEFAYKSF